MRLIGSIQYGLAVGQDRFSLARVDHGWGEQAETGVAVLLVVPREELLAESAAVLDTAEAVGEIGAILQGSELAFRIGIVVGDVRPAMRLVTPRSARRKATGLEVMTRPRSA